MKMAAIMRVTASRSNTRVGRQRLSPHRQKPVGTLGLVGGLTMHA